MNYFYRTGEQFARIALLLSTDTWGKERVDDRRVFNAIVHMPKSCDRGVDAPRRVHEFRKTPYNRSVRWAAMGV